MSASLRAWQRAELRTDEEFDRERPVSSLELFFDLVFVVVISRLAHHLAGHLDGAGVVTFAVQFLAVFWVWNSFAYYTERFESDGLENRLFTFLAIVPVAGLAVFGEEGIGATYVGFALAYLLARGVNQAGWVRAGAHVPVFRPIAARFVTGYATSTAIILASFAATGTTRVVMFTGAVLVDIATPYFTVKQQSALPRLSTSKFPERFSLFTMIVLGESVVGVIVGLSELEDQRVLDGAGIAAGVLGLGIGFSLWWIYSDFVARRAPKPVFVTALFWVYLHLATLTAITATGVGVSIAIADTAIGSLSDSSRFLLVGSVMLGLVGVAALETTLARDDDEPTHPRLSPALKLGMAGLVGMLGLLDLGWSTHVLFAVLLAGLAVPMAYGAAVWFGGFGGGRTAPATRSPGTSGSTRAR
ncbi:MAG: low temperature requirement protein A [Geodermatophilaceae bacterium]|nr:low temperature requirement protein A [Geodermatophilaceae bacterium]